EDGIRCDLVTGVQTCALPISCVNGFRQPSLPRSRGRLSAGRARQCARRQNAPSPSIDSIGSSIPCAARGSVAGCRHRAEAGWWRAGGAGGGGEVGGQWGGGVV